MYSRDVECGENSDATIPKRYARNVSGCVWGRNKGKLGFSDNRHLRIPRGEELRTVEGMKTFVFRDGGWGRV